MTKQEYTKKILAALKAKGLLNEKAVKKFIAKKKLNEGPLVPPTGAALYDSSAMYKMLAKAFITWFEDEDYTVNCEQYKVDEVREDEKANIFADLSDEEIKKMLILSTNGIEEILEDYVNGGQDKINEMLEKMDIGTYEVVQKSCELLKRPDILEAFYAADQ